MRAPERQSAGVNAADPAGKGGRRAAGLAGRSRGQRQAAGGGQCCRAAATAAAAASHRAAGRGMAPRQGSRGPVGGAAAGAQPLSPLRIASSRPQRGGRGGRGGRVAAGLSGPLRHRRRSTGNKKPPPGQGQGQGPQGGAVGAGVSPARSAGPSRRPGAAACRGRRD